MPYVHSSCIYIFKTAKNQKCFDLNDYHIGIFNFWNLYKKTSIDADGI